MEHEKCERKKVNTLDKLAYSEKVAGKVPEAVKGPTRLDLGVLDQRDLEDTPHKQKRLGKHSKQTRKDLENTPSKHVTKGTWRTLPHTQDLGDAALTLDFSTSLEKGMNKEWLLNWVYEHTHWTRRGT